MVDWGWLFRSAAQREAKARAAENTRRAAEGLPSVEEEQNAARAKARAEARAEAEFQEKSNAAKAEKNLKDITVDHDYYKWEYRRYPWKILPVEKGEWTEIVKNKDVIKAVNAIEDAANINILMNTIFKIFGLEEDSRALASAVRYASGSTIGVVLGMALLGMKMALIGESFQHQYQNGGTSL